MLSWLLTGMLTAAALDIGGPMTHAAGARGRCVTSELSLALLTLAATHLPITDVFFGVWKDFVGSDQGAPNPPLTLTLGRRKVTIRRCLPCLSAQTCPTLRPDCVSCGSARMQRATRSLQPARHVSGHHMLLIDPSHVLLLGSG